MSVDKKKLEQCFQIPLGTVLGVRKVTSQRAETVCGELCVHRTQNWVHFCHLFVPPYGLNVCSLPPSEGGNNQKTRGPRKKAVKQLSELATAPGFMGRPVEKFYRSDGPD